jgi:hypothetical protein
LVRSERYEVFFQTIESISGDEFPAVRRREIESRCFGMKPSWLGYAPLTTRQNSHQPHAVTNVTHNHPASGD